MTNKELIQKLQLVYDPGQSDKGRQFVRRSEQRSLKLLDVICNELRYIGLPGIIEGIFMLVLMFVAFISREIYFMWVFSAVLPVAGLILIAALGRSERFGMCEMEAVTRFSIRFVRMTRMLILGCFSFITIIASSVALGCRLEIGVTRTLVYIACPYLLNAFGCLLILRKWHAAENIFGCIGSSLATALIPLAAERMNIIQTVSIKVLAVACICLLGLAVKESILYIRERENTSWSLS